MIPLYHFAIVQLECHLEDLQVNYDVAISEGREEDADDYSEKIGSVASAIEYLQMA